MPFMPESTRPLFSDHPGVLDFNPIIDEMFEHAEELVNNWDVLSEGDKLNKEVINYDYIAVTVTVTVSVTLPWPPPTPIPLSPPRPPGLPLYISGVFPFTGRVVLVVVMPMVTGFSSPYSSIVIVYISINLFLFQPSRS